MSQLSIVVTCTDRKTLPPAPGLSARELPEGSLPERADMWRARVHSCDAERRTLRDLYKGEAWKCSLDLEKSAAALGLAPTTYVASAGLGLRQIDDVSPGYAATFATGHADSVVKRAGDAHQWWSALAAAPTALALADLPERPTLIVLSAAYSAPLADDLRALAAKNPDVLVVGGGQPVPRAKHVVANRALRAELRGTAMSLNQRIAQAWLNRLNGRPLTAPELFPEWDHWVDQVQQHETWNRTSMSDEAVIQAIRSMIDANQRLTWSPALRQLRDSGYACEQKRFKRLFTKASEGR